MNELREEIARKGNQLMPMCHSCFYFTDNGGKNINTVIEEASLIIGICSTEEGVEIKVQDNTGEINELALQSPNFQFEDLVRIIEELNK